MTKVSLLLDIADCYASALTLEDIKGRVLPPKFCHCCISDSIYIYFFHPTYFYHEVTFSPTGQEKRLAIETLCHVILHIMYADDSKEDFLMFLTVTGHTQLKVLDLLFSNQPISYN